MDILDQHKKDANSTPLRDSYPFISIYEEEYLKSLDISDLITYMEVQPESANFKKAEKILLSREGKLIHRANNLEKKLEMYKSKCSELSIALEEKNRKCIAIEGKIEEFQDYKMICSKLEEKANHLEENYNIVCEKEKAAMQIVSKLSSDLEECSKNTNEEIIELKMENKDLQCTKQKDEKEIEFQKRRCEELEKMLEHTKELKKNLEMYKTSCSELSTTLEEEKKKSFEMEGKLEEYKEYKMTCKVLEGKVASLEEDCKNVTEREKKVIQNITNLSIDLENVRSSSKKELIELETKNKDLECVRQKLVNEVEAQKKQFEKLEKRLMDAKELEKDLETYRAKCSGLSIKLEEQKKVNIALEIRLGEFKEWKKLCEELEKDLETYRVKFFESSIKLEEQKKVNIALEIRLGEFKVCKKLCEEMKKDLETYRAKCSELSTKLEEQKKMNVSLEIKLGEFEECKKLCGELKDRITCLKEDSELHSEREKSSMEKITNLSGDLEKLNGELNDVKAKNQDLEREKQTSENEIRSQKEKCKELEKMMNNAIELEKDLEICKVKCSRLEIALDEKKKKNIALEGELEEFNECKKFCQELKEKVICLEEDCKLVSEREKSALERIAIMSGVVEKRNVDKTEEFNELKAKIKDLESAKQKADDGNKIHKRRYKELKSRATKLESGILALICEAQISEKAKVEVRNDVPKKKRKTNENKTGEVQSEMIGGLNSACSSKLKLKLKTSGNKCDEKVPDSTGTDSVCHSTVKVSSGEQVKGYKCDEKVPDSTGTGSVCHSAADVSGGGQVEGTADKCHSTPRTEQTPVTADKFPSIYKRKLTPETADKNSSTSKRKWTPETVIEKSESLGTAIAKENRKMDKRQRNPPNRLNL